jgi:hypothetical protein
MTKPHSLHTPGPWRVNEDAAGITVVDSEGWIVAEGIGGFENERGTARLIAAAPELYEALEEAERLLSNHAVHEDDLPPIRAVLAKARGQQ